MDILARFVQFDNFGPFVHFGHIVHFGHFFSFFFSYLSLCSVGSFWSLFSFLTLLVHLNILDPLFILITLATLFICILIILISFFPLLLFCPFVCFGRFDLFVHFSHIAQIHTVLYCHLTVFFFGGGVGGLNKGESMYRSFVKKGCSSNYNNMVINAYLVVRLVIFRSAYQVLYGPKLKLDISSPLLNAAAAANFQISTKKLMKVNLHVFVC